MDVYKLMPGNRLWKNITKDNFEADTNRRPRWYRIRDGKEMHFAVCPACDNPIQIIGLYRLPSNVERPYGRHLTHGVPDLAENDPEAREHCPYFLPRPHKKSARRKKLEGIPLKILDLLITQFDRVLYLVRKETGITFSRKLVKNMLVKYRAEEGYLYTGATLMNVPWIFAYMADSHSLFNQRVDANEELTQAILEKVPAAAINDDGRVVSRVFPDGKKRFFDLGICFIHHRLSKDKEDGGLTETMTMVVSTAENGEFKDVYRKTITFDHQHFQNLINLPDDRARRQTDLIELAHEVLGDLCGS